MAPETPSVLLFPHPTRSPEPPLVYLVGEHVAGEGQAGLLATGSEVYARLIAPAGAWGQAGQLHLVERVWRGAGWWA